jgi:uncharacterized membrane protein
MAMLIAAATVFIAIHLLISGTGLRDAITGIIGEGPYLGLFSLASLAVIVWMVMAFNSASASGDNRLLYDPGPGFRDLGIPIVGIAFLIGVPGLFTPNPTSVRMEATAAKAETVRGVLRITRHPFLWGVALWAAFHTLANGAEAAVIFFGTFFIVALSGTFAIDAKRRRKMGDDWVAFAARTSNIPFAAMLSGRTPFSAREYFDWRFFVALGLFVALLFAHPHIFGVSPFPGGAVPI